MADIINEIYLKEISENLKELVKWSKFSAKKQLKEIINQNLTTENDLKIFELTDGINSTRDISKLLGNVSHVTVATIWKKWQKLGIVEPSLHYQGRFQKICSLEEIGMAIQLSPEPKKVSIDQKDVIE